jgi:hypothetical protein
MIEPLLKAIRKCGFRGDVEWDLHTAIVAALTAAGIEFTREYELTRADRPDFFLNDGTVIECKVKGSMAAAARQLDRYAQHDAVKRLVLVTSRMQHARVPDEVQGKEVHVVVLHQLP